MDHELVSVKSLSQMLDVKERTIREWVAKRAIPYHKLGRLVRFDIKQIKAWYAGNVVHPFAADLIKDKML